MGLVVVDRQHVGKQDNLRDTGAQGDLDRDGKAGILEREAMLTALYGFHAEARLRELGHDVIPMSDGRYSERHARANAYAKSYAGPVVYIACHLNAGGGAYGACLHDQRSAGGKRLALAVADKLRASLPELVDVHTWGCGPTGDWTRAYSTIAGVYEGRPVGLCFEPCFLDGAHSSGLLSSDGLRRIGSALADGINSYFQQQR